MVFINSLALPLAFGLAGLVQAGQECAAPQPYVNYSTVTGYFLQDEPSTNPSTFDYTKVNFGLINRTYDVNHAGGSFNHSSSSTQWQRFYEQVVWLNRNAPREVEYKVLFMGRHGEGWHNAAESFYGTPAWNCYWAELNGNGTATWSDPQLTVNGIRQAQIAHDFWQQQIDQQKIHTPDLFYVSPLTRCLQTVQTTFDGLRWPSPDAAAKYAPVVLEKLRENISIHTCDRRSNKTAIERAFPAYRVEPGFAECDGLWNGVSGESSSSENVRSLAALNQLWNGNVFDDHNNNDNKDDNKKGKSLFISITSHSGELGSLLSVLGHRSFSLNTGAVIPVLVKAETVAPPTPTSTQPWQVSPHCTVPPVASSSVCLCPASAAPVTTPLVPTSGCQ